MRSFEFQGQLREKPQGPEGWCPKFPGCPSSEVQEAFSALIFQEGDVSLGFKAALIEAFNKPIENEDLTIKKKD